MTIRAETPDDAVAVAGVHVRAWQVGYAGIMPAEVLARLNVAAWAQRRRDTGTAEPDHPFRTLLATEHGVVVGLVTFGPYRVDQDRDRLDHAYGEILTMYVEPARWGGGIGDALLTAALAGLAGRGWTKIRLWVLAANHRGRRFYERAGLVPDGTMATYQVPRSPGQAPLGLAELRYRARLDGPRIVPGAPSGGTLDG